MTKTLASVILLAGSLGIVSKAHGQVTYMQVCTLYGAGYRFIPKTQICTLDYTGDSREETNGFTWRSILPYPEGKWVNSPQAECGGKLYKVGTFKSTDFTLNPWGKKQSPPFTLKLPASQFITKVMMSGGFYDPNVPGNRSGVDLGIDGLCLRFLDPTVQEDDGPPLPNPPPFKWGGGGLPLGCVSNSRILNMPETYSVSSTASYPQIDLSNPYPDPTIVVGPYLFGSQLVVTTDLGLNSFTLLSYCDPNAGSCALPVYDADTKTVTPPGPGLKPRAGSVTVSVCVEGGAASPGGNSQGGNQ